MICRDFFGGVYGVYTVLMDPYSKMTRDLLLKQREARKALREAELEAREFKAAVLAVSADEKAPEWQRRSAQRALAALDGKR